MDNIFTISKYDTLDDGAEAETINMEDLYEKKREHDVAQHKIFNKMLKRVHSKIQITSRQRAAEKLCWFVVPEIMLGVPFYDQGTCIGYIMDKLKTNGFRVQYIHPNLLMISWDHWVPKYVIEEIKSKTGKVYDSFGNDLTPTPIQDKETNARYGVQINSNQTRVEYKQKDGVFQKNRKPEKKYTPIEEYRPQGTMVYDESLLFDLTKKMSK